MGFPHSKKCLCLSLSQDSFNIVYDRIFFPEKTIMTYTLVIFRGRAEGTPLSYLM
jgi:hypothetical protein